MSLSSMLQLGMPHINVLSKIDLAQRHSDKLQFGLDFYTEVLDLNYLLQALDEDKITKKYRTYILLQKQIQSSEFQVRETECSYCRIGRGFQSGDIPTAGHKEQEHALGCSSCSR